MATDSLLLQTEMDVYSMKLINHVAHLIKCDRGRAIHELLVGLAKWTPQNNNYVWTANKPQVPTSYKLVQYGSQLKNMFKGWVNK